MIATGKVEVVALSIADAPQMPRFISEQSPGGKDKYQVFLDRLHWYDRNPANKPDVPLGWGVQGQDGALVGAMLCIPVDFMVSGNRTTMLMSSSFYVDPAHRGCGLPIFVAYRALERKYVLYASTANEISGRLWQTCKASPVAGSEYESVGPIRWAPLVEEGVFRKFGAVAGAITSKMAFVANLRAGLPRVQHVSLTRLNNAEDVGFDCRGNDAVQPARDAAFIRWRYFDQPSARFELYRFTQENGKGEGHVAVRLSRRGYREQIRVLSIADLWGATATIGFEALIGALAAKYSSEVDLIVLRGFTAFENEATELGFLRREFGYPTGWYIDRNNLLAGKQFSLVPATTDQL